MAVIVPPGDYDFLMASVYWGGGLLGGGGPTLALFTGKFFPIDYISLDNFSLFYVGIQFSNAIYILCRGERGQA